MENSDMPAGFHVSETFVGISADNQKLLAVTLLIYHSDRLGEIGHSGDDDLSHSS